MTSTSSASGLSKRNMNGSHPHQGLRYQQAPIFQPEYARGQLHGPQEPGGLVHGDEVRGVQRAEQESLPALGGRLDGGGVELVAPAVAAQAGQVEQAGADEQPAERRGGPHRGARAAAEGERRWT